MTNIEILQKAIRKACDNKNGVIYSAPLERNWSLLLATYPIIIFSHDFAKAFWGEKRTEYLYDSFDKFIQYLNKQEFTLSNQYFGIGGEGENCIIGYFEYIIKFTNRSQFYKIKSLFGDLILKNFEGYSCSGQTVENVEEALTSYFISYDVPGTPGADILVKLDENNYKRYMPKNLIIEHRGWQYHLQQMVLEKEPLKYLEKFLD